MSGPIDLKTDGELAMGYEVGAILSKTYTVGATPSDTDLSSDLAVLLHAYAELMTQFPTSLLALDIEITDRNYQEAAQSIKPVEQGSPSTTGPQPLPMMGYAKGVSKYVRSPNVANRALQMANGTCALSTPMEPHRTFMSRVRKTNYVEAHHLVPFSQQKNFAYSLDVEENIVALCPTCHKLLHYGTAKEQFSPLKALLHTRHALLRNRGIEVTFNQLKEMYRVLAEED
jgi:5-methylcytosine-specific restriction protein A